jgi:hypothetical protein
MIGLAFTHTLHISTKRCAPLILTGPLYFFAILFKASKTQPDIASPFIMPFVTNARAATAAVKYAIQQPYTYYFNNTDGS